MPILVSCEFFCFFVGRLRFPVLPGLDLPVAPPRQVVVVRPAVALALFYEPLVDERVEVRIQPAVMDLLLVVVFEFVLDREAVWLILSGDRVQEVTLKSCQVVHQSAVW